MTAYGVLVQSTQVRPAFALAVRRQCIVFIQVNSGPAFTTDRVTVLTQGDGRTAVYCLMTLVHSGGREPQCEGSTVECYSGREMTFARALFISVSDICIGSADIFSDVLEYRSIGRKPQGSYGQGKSENFEGVKESQGKQRGSGKSQGI